RKKRRAHQIGGSARTDRVSARGQGGGADAPAGGAVVKAPTGNKKHALAATDLTVGSPTFGSATITEPYLQPYDIDRRLAGLKRAYESSSGTERDRHLHAALNLCGSFRPLPEWAVRALSKQLASRLPSTPKARLHHHILRAFLDLRDNDGEP